MILSWLNSSSQEWHFHEPVIKSGAVCRNRQAAPARPSAATCQLRPKASQSGALVPLAPVQILRLCEVHLLSGPASRSTACTRHNIHLDRTRVFGLWDAMSLRKSFSSKIVEAEANPASNRRVKAPPLEGMEWTTMNKDNANESLLILIGELLYKNQLLRESIATKDEVIELIDNHLMSAATSACSCGVANQLTFLRNTVK